MRHALALLTLVLFAVPAAAQPATVSLDDAVRGIEAEYGRMTDLKAEISQTSFNKSLNQTIPPAAEGSNEEGRQGRGVLPRADPQGNVADRTKNFHYTTPLRQDHTRTTPPAA